MEEHAWETMAREQHHAGVIQGWSVDEDSRIVTFYVFADEPLPAFPANLEGYAVLLAPLPRARAFEQGTAVSKVRA